MSPKYILKDVTFCLKGTVIEVYVFVDTALTSIKGIHHKTFPGTIGVVKIFKSFAKDNPIYWPLSKPPTFGARAA